MVNGKTMKNLEAAFSGESQANRKYLAFAKKADEEGFHQAAKLFRAAAEAETIHAHTHLRSMGMIGSTAENLDVAVEGETYEFKSMYPAFIEDARNEGETQAERSFRLANEAEKVHEGYFSIDKKNKMIDPSVKRGSEDSDDISASKKLLDIMERKGLEALM